MLSAQTDDAMVVLISAANANRPNDLAFMLLPFHLQKVDGPHSGPYGRGSP